MQNRLEYEDSVDMVKLANEFGLTEDEYKMIEKIMGRSPNIVELGMYSVMWSEHCSYKNSLNELKKLPRSGNRILVPAGEENAGIIDIGEGLGVVFKIESHNHPSAIEPYNGAATGVGGIMRDIFTMGARPIACLDSLKFGDITQSKTKYLFKNIIKGIGDYGNCFGVPTVGGDTYFDNCYNENPIVNVLSVGIVEHGKITRAKASEKGYLVLIVGSSTGRDGIHGATFASEIITATSSDKRPSVQVGDPFTEKKLLEAVLEANKENLIAGIQDMGAAGLTCSTVEMSARGKSGMKIHLERVPLRDLNMSPFEIMLSESQERMLVVIKPENFSKIKEIFHKWDLICENIGEVTDSGMIEVYKDGSIVAQLPASSLVVGGGAPVYKREGKFPEYIYKLREINTEIFPEPKNYNDCLMSIIQSPNIKSKRWIFEQYDSMVQGNTILYNGSDAAVIRIKGTEKAIAVKTDCNPRYVYLNPYEGAKIAVAESARNVVCVGAKPLAITNCLNYGNPYNPEIYWQFQQSIKGISDACNILNTPVTGGNVSFYNENLNNSIYPTPVIGMIGIIENLELIITPGFKQKDDIILLLGKTNGHIGGSEYLKICHNLTAGDAPTLNLNEELNLQQTILRLIRKKLINSCHDLSEGGLAIAIVESCLFSDIENIGVRFFNDFYLRPDYFLFSEDQSRVIISTSLDKLSSVESELNKSNVFYKIIGEVTNNGIFEIDKLINIAMNVLKKAYFSDYN